MAISYVGGRTQIAAGVASGTFNVALTGLTGGLAAQPAAGDLVLIGYGSGKTADQVIAIAGYGEVAELYANGSGADANLEVAYKFMGAVPDTVAAVPNSGSTADAVAVSVRVYRGVDPNNPFDVLRVLATGTGSTSPNPGAITPATAGAVLVGFGAGAIAGTGAAFASADLVGFHSANSPDTNDIAIGAGHKLDWSAGAFDAAAWTGGLAGAGNSWSAAILALRPLTTVTHQGAMTASGAGTLAMAGKRQLSGASALAASSSAGAAGRLTFGGRMAALGAGTASQAARMTAGARQAVAAAGTLAAAATRRLYAAAARSGSGETNLSARLAARGSASAAGAGTMSASASVVTTSELPPPPNRLGMRIGLGL